MSGVIDIGDALDLTFNATTGSRVLMSWLDPNLVSVIDGQEVAESPAGSGKFPHMFTGAAPAGMWTAAFSTSGKTDRYYVRVTSPGLPPFAAIGDVGIQFGTLTTAQQTLTGYLLKVASKMLRQRFPLIDTQVNAGTLDSDVVANAAASMVLRVLRNPGGLRSETTGPFSRTYDTTAAAGLLVVTADEVDAVTPTPLTTMPDGPGAIAGTIRVQGGLMPPAPYGSSYGTGYSSWPW